MDKGSAGVGKGWTYCTEHHEYVFETHTILKHEMIPHIRPQINWRRYSLLCECKSGRVRREEVFNFWTKVYDIRSHFSMLALTGELPDPETREFLEKNPSVICLENLGKKTKKEIIDLIHGNEFFSKI